MIITRRHKLKNCEECFKEFFTVKVSGPRAQRFCSRRCQSRAKERRLAQKHVGRKVGGGSRKRTQNPELIWHIPFLTRVALRRANMFSLED